MSETSNQIVGLIRFSYIARAGFSHSSAPPWKQQQLIFDPARLERRFMLFEKLALPSLRAQTDQDYECVFLISDALPENYVDRLSELIKTLPKASLSIQRPKIHYRAVTAAFDQVRNGYSRYFTSFRFDDDDLLDVDYIARLRRLSSSVMQISGDTAPATLSFNRGLYLYLDEGGTRLVDVREQNPLGIGNAMISRMQDETNVFARNHRKMPAFFTAYSEVKTPSWIRTVHKDNDANPLVYVEGNDLTKQEENLLLETHFGITRSGLDTACRDIPR